MKKLPINTDPIIKTYQLYALPYSALLAIDPSSIIYALNNFIQVYFNPGAAIEFIYYYRPFPQWKCTAVKSILMQNYVFECNMPVINYISSAIDMDLYCYCSNINEYYIPERFAYQKYEFNHDLLIYGYDDESFNILGYDNKGKFKESVITKQQFSDAFKMTVPHSQLILFQEYPLFKKEMDFELIKELLNDYINSYNTTEKYRYFVDPFQNRKYGIDAFRHLVLNLKESINNKAIDIRYWDFMAEHKRLMLLRIEKLCEYYNMNYIASEYEDITKKAKLLKNLVLMLNVSKKKNTVDKIEAIYDEMEKKEIILLKEVIKILSQK